MNHHSHSHCGHRGAEGDFPDFGSLRALFEHRMREGRGGRRERHGERHFGFGPGEGFERGFGRRERLFDAGDIKLVVIKLLAEQPSYGYQLIKTMEQRLAGGYTPSAGIIYPTLTLLEEEGLATASMSEAGKKVYTVTPEGLAVLEQNKERLGELFARLDEAEQSYRRGRSPELMKAFMNLRRAVMARMVRGNISPEQINKIAEAIESAAKSIDEF
jgi:DNA-binding PadR family transcriptional regulator